MDSPKIQRNEIMMKIPRLRLLTAALIVTAGGAVGCNWLSWPFYLITPSKPPPTVDAEFDLEDAKVAVVIVASERLIHQHDDFRLQLAGIIGKELKDRLDDVTPVAPGRIVKYQDSNVDWNAIDQPALAKKFGADYLLQVALRHYALRESGSQTLYRGNIMADVALFDASRPPEKARVWRGGVEAMYPKEGYPVGRIGDAVGEFRVNTERLFAENLVKKFRSYKAEVK